MTTITDIKGRVQGLSPARFQEFCDTLIHKNGYGRVHGYGMQAGTGIQILTLEKTMANMYSLLIQLNRIIFI